MKLVVVGGGWAGIATAVRACEAGHEVMLLEMAPRLGGRARSIEGDAGNGGERLDNGQHILIGAYRETLELMAVVGCDVESLLARLPLELRYPDGRGLRLGAGPTGLLAGLLGARGVGAGDRLALTAAMLRWALAGWRCDATLSVDELCRGLGGALRALLIDPLCVAALNTPAPQASGAVFLRVLHDALLGGAGSSDLLLPRRGLSELLPEPATHWLERAGARVVPGRRVQGIERDGRHWRVDGEACDAVVLACSAAEASRLSEAWAPEWSRQARALHYEPIVTVYLHSPGARLPAPMTALVAAADAPAQFAFDHGALGSAAGRFAFVVSGAAGWIEAGLDATAQAVLRQAQQAFAPGTWPTAPTLIRTLAEKRATFRCTPGLRRPRAAILPRLAAAGDYVEGAYPATLEGAVRAGRAAIDIIADA
ncbi:MAG: hydroxysqualene dehydroxylase HpnE, partial [Burkholderiales bacterium]|nr:hydroxysqualene dehydroxylase HpnE [Burkholderiales bacterium]